MRIRYFIRKKSWSRVSFRIYCLPPESNPFSSSAKLLDSLTLRWYLVASTSCLTTDWVSPAGIFTLRGSVKASGSKEQKMTKGTPNTRGQWQRSTERQSLMRLTMLPLWFFEKKVPRNMQITQPTAKRINSDRKKIAKCNRKELRKLCA